MYNEIFYEGVLEPESGIIYTKCSFKIWVDIGGFAEWVPFQFVCWYRNLDSELVGPLRGFDLDDGDAEDGEVIDP